MKLTKKQILECRSPAGGWTKKQLAILGIEWPPEKGWMWRAVAKDITAEEYQTFKRSCRQYGSKSQMDLF